MFVSMCKRIKHRWIDSTQARDVFKFFVSNSYQDKFFAIMCM